MCVGNFVPPLYYSPTATLAVKDVRNSVEARAMGGKVESDIGTVADILGNLMSGIGPKSQVVANFSDFVRLCLKRVELFWR